MLSPNPNSLYASYDLNESEYLEGCLLSQTQRARIQNLRMETIEQKLNLTPSDLTAASKESYWQQEAYLRGQLDVLTTLLVGADVAQSALLESQDPSIPDNSPL
mgnify:FL=1